MGDQRGAFQTDGRRGSIGTTAPSTRVLEGLSEAEVNAFLAKTEKAAKSGEFEPFKTASILDSTAQNPAWLGEEPEHVKQLMPV